MVKQQITIIRNGLNDEEIIKQAVKKKNTKRERFCKIASIALCFVVTLVFLFSVYASFYADGKIGKIPAVKVIASPSMSSKYEGNDYLFENKLDNQLDTFDLVLLHELPAEEDIQLYDIVVYKMEDYMVIHRIIEIEEPNEKHPNERYFLLQGDAAQYPDRFPVKYSQMKSIYRNEKIPFVGSFVYFMQSPAGILCYILIIFAFIAMPIIERKLEREETLRLQKIRKEDNSK